MIRAKISSDRQQDIGGNEYFTYSVAYRTKDHDGIFGYMQRLLCRQGDAVSTEELAADIASWCELASVGETYSFPDGEVEIVDD